MSDMHESPARRLVREAAPARIARRNMMEQPAALGASLAHDDEVSWLRSLDGRRICERWWSA